MAGDKLSLTNSRGCSSPPARMLSTSTSETAPVPPSRRVRFWHIPADPSANSPRSERPVRVGPFLTQNRPNRHVTRSLRQRGRAALAGL
jgi:hypothetical protein